VVQDAVGDDDDKNMCADVCVCVYERERLASTSAAVKTITKDRYLNSFMMKAWPGVKIEKIPHSRCASIYSFSICI
jgi:hypothetical protein